MEHKVEEEDEMQPNVVGHRSRRPGGGEDTGCRVIVFLGKTWVVGRFDDVDVTI